MQVSCTQSHTILSSLPVESMELGLDTFRLCTYLISVRFGLRSLERSVLAWHVLNCARQLVWLLCLAGGNSHVASIVSCLRIFTQTCAREGRAAAHTAQPHVVCFCVSQFSSRRGSERASLGRVLATEWQCPENGECGRRYAEDVAGPMPRFGARCTWHGSELWSAPPFRVASRCAPVARRVPPPPTCRPTVHLPSTPASAGYRLSAV